MICTENLVGEHPNSQHRYKLQEMKESPLYKIPSQRLGIMCRVDVNNATKRWVVYVYNAVNF